MVAREVGLIGIVKKIKFSNMELESLTNTDLNGMYTQYSQLSTLNEKEKKLQLKTIEERILHTAIRSYQLRRDMKEWIKDAINHKCDEHAIRFQHLLLKLAVQTYAILSISKSNRVEKIRINDANEKARSGVDFTIILADGTVMPISCNVLPKYRKSRINTRLRFYSRFPQSDILADFLSECFILWDIQSYGESNQRCKEKVETISMKINQEPLLLEIDPRYIMDRVF